MLMDKETRINNLREALDEALGKIKFLQATCRRAGAQIKKLEAELKEATQWKHDEVEEFRKRLRDGPAYEKRANDYTEQ
jgi:peptidoglycan hydrolase CwlO-like protein